MGWCQEFAVDIRDGCDHLMVAGRDRCSCSECGAFCHGKFPGCATVWARGPVQVAIRRTNAASTNGVGGANGGRGPTAFAGDPPELLAGNGKRGTPPLAALEPAPRRELPFDPVAVREFLLGEVRALNGAASRSDSQLEVASLVASLRADIQILSSKVDRLQERATVAEDLARMALEATVDGHRQTKRAFEEEYGAFANDLVRLRRQLESESQRRSQQDCGSIEAVIEHLDSRLEWLVSELSDRFVILGNQLVKISGQLAAAERHRVSSPNGTASHDVPPAPAPLLPAT